LFGKLVIDSHQLSGLHLRHKEANTLLPTTSVDQLGATLARWMGLSAADALEIFPNLANFSQRDLGFMV
jgi:uncharacterized protein (DUF1501 family)